MRRTARKVQAFLDKGFMFTESFTKLNYKYTSRLGEAHLRNGRDRNN